MFISLGKLFISAIVVSIISACQSPATTRNPPKILLPLYIYPNWYEPENYSWSKVISAANQVPIIAIINPNNGPDGGSPNDDYQKGLEDLKQADIPILGYVYTKYGDRPIIEVKQDIDLYATYYDLDGIFLDESASSAKQVDYYRDIYQYIKQKAGLDRVVINPGTHTDEQYSIAPATDTAVIFENYPQPWLEYRPQDYTTKYDRDRFASLIHSVADVATMKKYIDLAMERNIGYIYITDDSPNNSDGDPWNSLPSYWQEEVDYLQSLSEK
ncbi:spherulation-specific family 4 protein [Waterburya agarophytonicola K14]|uniref:Spherulation-specific family 4 protein n=1 Tax=Waterburya agarophytonicola KI4 TaxID=2874699 RepID=A0A964FIR7_9CYAN|nr:spherulation-specific family 4 protein [Waterburya agarophytonicola]MCC0178664.1 spherulation-specific family 4 protein [Waterburya agarophytonicola KI4]